MTYCFHFRFNGIECDRKLELMNITLVHLPLGHRRTWFVYNDNQSYGKKSASNL